MIIEDQQLDALIAEFDIKTLVEWDVLVFLYRHQSSLISAEQIARLLSYDSTSVIEALDMFQNRGLITRSRVSQGVRLYRFGTVEQPDGTPGSRHPNRLMSDIQSRTLRTRLARRLALRQTNRSSAQNPVTGIATEQQVPWRKIN